MSRYRCISVKTLLNLRNGYFSSFIDNIILSQREITSLVIKTYIYNNMACSSGKKNVFSKGFSTAFNVYFQIVLNLASGI